MITKIQLLTFSGFQRQHNNLIVANRNVLF